MSLEYAQLIAHVRGHCAVMGCDLDSMELSRNPIASAYDLVIDVTDIRTGGTWHGELTLSDEELVKISRERLVNIGVVVGQIVMEALMEWQDSTDNRAHALPE